MCHIGSPAVTCLTSMTKIARRPSPGRYCTWSWPHAGAVARRDVSGEAIKALFIASCSRTLIRLPEASLLLLLSLLLSLSRRKTRISGRSPGLWLCGCIVFSLQTAALPHLSDLHDVYGSAPNSIESWVAKWKKRKTQANKKERQHIIHFKSQKLPAVRGWTFY